MLISADNRLEINIEMSYVIRAKVPSIELVAILFQLVQLLGWQQKNGNR